MNKLSLFRIVLGFEVNEIHDTEPIDDDDDDDNDDISLVENLFNDTELVDDGETLDHEFGGFDQVVDDSEDDGGGGGGKGSVDSSKQQCLLERRSIKAGDMLLESDGSNDQECHTGRNESDPLLVQMDLSDEVLFYLFFFILRETRIEL